MTGATLQLVLLVTIGSAAAGAISVAAAAPAQVDSFSYRAFDATTARDLVVMPRSNTSELTPATRLFDDHVAGSGELNRTEGYLLLSRGVNSWHAGHLEASFNASFALTASGAAARVAFVVLCIDDDDRNSYPVLGSVIGYLKVVDNGTAAAAAGAVWVEYDAAKHRLLVYEAAGGGGARPAEAVVNERIGEGTDAKYTTGKAMVGFFAGSIQDIVDGVRDWNMTTVASSGGDGWKKKGTSSWWMLPLVLLVVLRSVAAMA